MAYIMDDRSGGFVNDSYPIGISIAGEAYTLPLPGQQLAVVILAEIYTKNGARRMKVSNEGYTFGIDAYSRARKFDRIEFPFRPSRESGSERDRFDGAPPGRSGVHQASGSGVVVAPGLIVTNAHVIENGVKFQVGRSGNALTPLAVDQLHDLALLQGPVDGLPIPLRIGAPIWLGEGVLASGYPLMNVLGADLKVTTGNISGLTGSGGDVSRFQFTAPIGSGSSGGAIIDECGNLVGITSASLAHGQMRERGSISENVNFGIRSVMVHEMMAAAGFQPSSTPLSSDSDRRNVVHRLRNSVVSILVEM
ncbi:S1C family serine protease [Sphingobium sp. Leaf26]|uniref:S1C family serine protease n=1 Tax=Sphingobium sp. Leaf26 TaxID=1735693 RepID=UPI001F340F7E|nr:serine protease [Sphingobium sp. Leaf26]